MPHKSAHWGHNHLPDRLLHHTAPPLRNKPEIKTKRQFSSLKNLVEAQLNSIFLYITFLHL